MCFLDEGIGNDKLLIANLPELHDVQNYRFGRITELVREAAKENNVAFVDLLPYLKKYESSKLWVTRPDPHPNAFANEILANGLFDAIRDLRVSAYSPVNSATH